MVVIQLAAAVYIGLSAAGFLASNLFGGPCQRQATIPGLPLVASLAASRRVVAAMTTTTTMQLDGSLRDELAEIARQDFAGVPLAEALRRLIKEHRVSKIMARYAELQSDPQEWASYRAEASLTDNAAGDGLPLGREEYPEYNE